MEFRTEAFEHRITAARDEERRAAREAIEALARPRLTGTAGAADAEAELQRRFEAIGYRIERLPFSFSTWPGRFGVPAAGLVGAAGAIGASTLLLLRRPGMAAAALGVAALVAGVGALLTRRTIRGLPMGRVETSNWLVTRPGARPKYLVVAHRDSKSQWVSTYLRTAGIVLSGFSSIALLLLAGVGALDRAWIFAPLVIAVTTLAVIGDGLLIACVVGNRSPGALDNATGLAALLGIARRERGNDDVAFLVTDAEELGLAGAYDAARRLPFVHGIINLDGLDDDGDFIVAERFGWPARRCLAPALAAAILASAGALDLHVTRRDLPPGVLVDHIPFARAGLHALTLLKGNARSLRRVHRPEDTADRLTGDGVAQTVALVSGALEVLRRTSIGSDEWGRGPGVDAA